MLCIASLRLQVVSYACCRLSWCLWSRNVPDLVDRFIRCLLLLPSISFQKRNHRFSISKQAAVTTFVSVVFEFVAKSLLLNFAGNINRCRLAQLSVYFLCLPFYFTQTSTLCLPRKSLPLPAPGLSEFVQVAGLYLTVLFHSPSKASPAKDRANTQSTKWVFRIVLDPVLTWFQAKARTYRYLVWFRNVRCLIFFFSITYFFLSGIVKSLRNRHLLKKNECTCSCLVYVCVKFDGVVIVWPPNAVRPHPPTRKLTKTFPLFLFRELCRFSVFALFDLPVSL